MSIKQKLLMCYTILFGSQSQIDSLGRKIEVEKMSYKELRETMKDVREAINNITMDLSVVNGSSRCMYGGYDNKIDS